MGLMQRIRTTRDANRRQKASQVRQEIANQLIVSPLCSDYENVFAQVQPLINDMKMVRPFGVGKNGGRLPIARTPELNLLNLPNDEMGWGEFAGSMFATWLTEDELDIHVHLNGRRVIGYTILAPGSKVYLNNGDYYFQVMTDEGMINLTRDEVMSLRFSRSPKNLQRGISPATAVRAWAQAEDVLAQYERAYIENGAIPASITFIRASSQDKFNQVRKELETNLRGASNHGKTIYVWRQFNNDTGESMDQVEVKTIQGNNSTLAIKELTDIINDHLNKAYGVSNFILGDDSSAKYDNAELSDYQFIKRRVYPALTAFWDQFQFELDRIVGGLGYGISFELELPDLTERLKVRAETNKIRTETLTAMIQSGAKPRDAVKALNLDDSWLNVARGIETMTLAGLAVDKINNLSKAIHDRKECKNHTLLNTSLPCNHGYTSCGCTATSQKPASVTQDVLPEMTEDEKKIYNTLLSMAERIYSSTPNIDAEGVIDEISEVLNRRAELGAIDGAEAISKLLKNKDVVEEIKSEIEKIEVSGTLKDRIKDRTAELVNNYGDETKRLMEQTLANSQGLSAGEIKKVLAQLYDKENRWRAERIARTETVYAFKSGRLDEDEKIADKYGLKMKLVWHARPGACDVCSAMDGEETTLGVAFADEKDGVFWEKNQWNDEGKIPAPHPNCRCYFDEVVEAE